MTARLSAANKTEGSTRKGPVNLLILIDKFDYWNSSVSGPVRYFSWLVERLDRRRFRPVVCSLRAAGPAEKVLRRLGLEVRFLGLGKYQPRAVLRVMQLVRSERIDLMHLNGYASTTIGRIVGLLTGVPAIVQEHYVDPGITRPQMLLERTLARVARSPAIAVSAYAGRFLTEAKGFDPAQVEVIWNGIPVERFASAPLAAGVRLRERWGLPPDRPVVGTVGMLHPNKGHRFLIEAVRELLQRGLEASLVVVGEGAVRADLEARCAALGLDGRVFLVGRHLDMPAVYRAFDIYAQASISEAAGLSVLEAMASGLPIVTSAAGGPNEVITDGVSGLIVPTEDSGALAAAIARLVREPGLARRLAAGAAAASRSFDLDETVRRIEAVYERVLEQRAAA
ncbi:glycosyltransferase [Benzoatithermus flavus]|uniref:Glycosyltransferase n=1 Tax=Benzoatithermus flavus TaxID=3108223 RepID=A0ABU8XLW1_9PROT